VKISRKSHALKVALPKTRKEVRESDWDWSPPYYYIGGLQKSMS